MTTAPLATPAARSTRCWTLQSADGAVDVEVTAADGDPLAAVLPALAATVGVEQVVLWTGSTPVPPETPLVAAELGHGAVLGLGRPGPRSTSRGGASALELRLVGGPDAGRTIPLTQGRHVLGRGAEATVHLEDPDVSRRHAVVEVGNGGVFVSDPGSTNGTRLDGEPVTSATQPWPAGSRLAVGASTVTVAGPGACPLGVEPGSGGRLLVRSGPRVTVPPPDAEVAFPQPPDPPPSRRLPWVAIALPALGGAAMAWLLHTPTFLFFAVLGPLVGVGSWASDRWSSRRTVRRDGAVHAVDLVAAQARLTDAVAADRRAAEAAHPDLATLCAVARRRSAPLWSRGRADADALTARLGLGPGVSRVTRLQPDGSRERERADALPVVLDLRVTGGLGIVGPRRWSLSALRALVAQLAVLHAPGEMDLLLLTDDRTAGDWRWARWLPHLSTGSPVASDDRVDAWLATVLAGRRARRDAVHPWCVVVVDRPVDPRLAERLGTARDAGVLVLTAAQTPSGLPAATGALLCSSGDVGDVATLTRDGCPEKVAFVADRASVETVSGLARDLAGLLPATPDGRLPGRVRLLELPLPGIPPNAPAPAAGAWLRNRGRLLTTLGVGEAGPVTVDLCREGPHALIAGTTGSGKSELLQTLIASLALAHPPDRCSFLLIDYKGGAAFAAATALPHTVGVLTDLDGQTTARALRSLTAELTRRETLLAAHRVTDLADLPDSVDLARLVIVVDEFATLAEELPDFVPGLVGIAQRGRSLGVHLVLATQRPGGVVSPEIRANCTLRLCLRTTDESDSRDVLGTPDAAHLTVDVPGRCFLRTGSGAPVPFQVARVTTGSGTDDVPTVRRVGWPAVDLAPPPEERRPEETDLARVAELVREAATCAGTAPPHRPWRPPLADRLDGAGLGRPEGRRVRLGLVDRPELQSREPLDLDLDEGGAWLAVGGPRSGRTTLLRTALAGAAASSPPEELHVHVLDHGGGALAKEAAGLPHAGTCVAGTDAFRTLRLVERLAQEVAARRAGARATAQQPRLLLLVDGAEPLMAQLDECDPQGGSAALLRLVRDGAAVGLTCVLTADRAVPGSRLAAAAQHRLVLPLPDVADYAVAGIRPGAVPRHRPPGRALLPEDEAECQLALPLELPADPGARPRLTATGPLRIVELPAEAALPTAAAETAGSRHADGSLPVVLGPGGDEGHPLVLDLARSGGLLVVGPPGSGRSSALAALTDQLRGRAARLLCLSAAGAGDALDPRDTEGIAAWLADAGPEPPVIVADDVGAPIDWPGLSASAPGAGRGPLLLAAGSPADLASHYQGPVAALRRSRQGLLLCPGLAEADLLGVRLPRTPLPVRPGSGWLVGPGGLQRVQVARRRAP